MTIGIGVVLPNAVLLVADGRSRAILNLDIPPDDNVQKISIINDSLAVIEIGINQATYPAVKVFEELASLDLDTEDLKEILDASVKIGWNYLLGSLSSAFDLNNKALKSALIIGGNTPSECYIGGVIHGTNIHDGPEIMVDIFDFLILGGEENHSRLLLDERFKKIKEEYTDRAMHSPEKLYCEVLNTAARTICDLESDIIGGTIRYVLLRPGYPAFHGTWVSEQLCMSFERGQLGECLVTLI